MLSAWIAVTPTFGYAHEETALLITGAGFDTKGSVVYQCRFSGVQNNTLTVSSTVVNTTAVRCSAPVWPFAAQDSTLVLVQDGTDLPYVGVATDTFPFDSSWSSMSVSDGPAEGGTIVRISGGGFDSSLTYSC
eukprot:818565-Rhodomonas_salina.1